MSADDVNEMIAKYDEIARLRRGDADGSISDPRPAMRALAGRFPGALRELDRLTMDEIERRRTHLCEVKQGEVDEAPWVSLVAAFHRRMRDELRGFDGRPLPRGHRTSAWVTESLAHERSMCVETARAMLMPWTSSRATDRVGSAADRSDTQPERDDENATTSSTASTG